MQRLVCWTSFNSKMVRLIANPREITYTETMFQFQNGSINSSNTIHLSQVFDLFQFQNGSINSKFLFCVKFLLFCFNSKMVRLIVRGQTDRPVKTMFQFQNGSINSCKPYGLILCTKQFQFQNGSINSKRNYESQEYKEVSIPKWFD